MSHALRIVPNGGLKDKPIIEVLCEAIGLHGMFSPFRNALLANGGRIARRIGLDASGSAHFR